MRLRTWVVGSFVGLFLFFGAGLGRGRVVSQVQAEPIPAAKPLDAKTLLTRLLARDADFDNRTLEIEQRWTEKVFPQKMLAKQRYNAIRFGQPDPGMPQNIPADFEQPHRVRHLLTLRGKEQTMENLGDRERLIDARFVFVNKGRRNTTVGGVHRAWNPLAKYLYLGNLPGRGDHFYRDLWQLQWSCGFGLASCIDSIESVQASGDKWVVTGRMALRTTYAPDDATRGRDPFELHLDRDLLMRKATLHFGFHRFEIETRGTVQTPGAPVVPAVATYRLFEGRPARLAQQFEFATIAVSAPLTDAQYAERTRIDPPPGTEIRDWRAK